MGIEFLQVSKGHLNNMENLSPLQPLRNSKMSSHLQGNLLFLLQHLQLLRTQGLKRIKKPQDPTLEHVHWLMH